MRSIHGTALLETPRGSHRAAYGCPSIAGSESPSVAKNYRDRGTQPIR